MGLDMYLTKEIYVGANWEHNHITGSISLKKEGKRIPVSLNKVTTIIEEVAYWRKANQIHNWFVQNVQDGVDDCNKYWVSVDKLKELYNLCKRVYKSRNDGGKLASELLPTSEGFFFGSYEYGEFYYEQIKDTMEMLRPFKNLEDSGRCCDFYYQSSW